MTAPFGRCPNCGAEEATKVADIVGWRLAGGVKLQTIGHRFSCQRCGELYAVGPNGVFRPHALALPITLLPRPVGEDHGRRGQGPPVEDGKTQAEREWKRPPLEEGLIPRERPRP